MHVRGISKVYYQARLKLPIDEDAARPSDDSGLAEEDECLTHRRTVALRGTRWRA